MLALQKPMPRGRYALLAAAHVLLLGGLLGAMVWSELNYLPPVGALAYLAGIGVLASLVALTIRRMRDAGMRGLLLLCVPTWVGGVLVIHLLYWWLLMALPMAHPGIQVDERLSITCYLLIICGSLLACATVAMLCAPSAPRHSCPPPAKAPAIVTALARSFCIRRKAPVSEFFAYVPLSIGLLCVLLTAFDHYVAWENMWEPFPISCPQHILLIPFILAPACAVLALPALSVALRRARDAGHFRRWLTALVFLVLGALLCLWAIVAAIYFPSESPLATFYVFSVYPFYAASFAFYSLYVFIKPGEKTPPIDPGSKRG